MLTEKQLNNYADVLIWGLKTARAQTYKKNDVVLVRYNLPALRLAEILQAAAACLGHAPGHAPACHGNHGANVL